MKFKVKDITTLSLLCALGIVLSIVDSFIPSFVVGMKLGLANIIILVSLYTYGFLPTLLINILRVFIASLLRGTFLSMGFMMSLMGALFSLLIMVLLKNIFKNLHICTISVVGSLFHSLAQIIVGSLYMMTTAFFYYLPILSLTSIITGIFIGLAAKQILKLNIIKKE